MVATAKTVELIASCTLDLLFKEIHHLGINRQSSEYRIVCDAIRNLRNRLEDSQPDEDESSPLSDNIFENLASSDWTDTLDTFKMKMIKTEASELEGESSQADAMVFTEGSSMQIDFNDTNSIKTEFADAKERLLKTDDIDPIKEGSFSTKGEVMSEEDVDCVSSDETAVGISDIATSLLVQRSSRRVKLRSTQYEQYEMPGPSPETSTKGNEVDTQEEQRRVEKSKQVGGISNEICCDQCGKRLSNKASLKQHRMIHTGELPHACHLCDRRFRQISTLQSHLIAHSNERPFVCPLCEMKFKHRNNLRSHVKTHSDEKPYACTLCGKKFKQFSNLSSHLKIHSDEKPYACTLCEKKFKDASNLRRHLQIHSDEKRFACTLCEKKFKRHSELRSHLKIHSRENSYAH